MDIAVTPRQGALQKIPVLKIIQRHRKSSLIFGGIATLVVVLHLNFVDNNTLKLNISKIFKENIDPQNVSNDAISTNINSAKIDKRQRSVSKCTGSYVKNIMQHPPDEECQKRLPKAIIVGIQKSGTRALLYFLSRHPEISVVLKPVEVSYFTNHYKESLEWYRNMMNCSFSNQISMEKSPMYFYCKRCPELIKRMDITTKIVITVKEPIERTLSQYAMQVRKKMTDELFKQLVIDEDGNVNTKSRLIKFSSYALYIRDWLQHFPRSQIHFVDGHRLETNPALELNSLERFLDVGSYFTCDKFVYNETKLKYCLKTESGGMDCLQASKGNKHLELSGKLRRKLKNFFRPLNREFFNLIGRAFDWGY